MDATDQSQGSFNPIACEPCRSKKCKCDRKLPTCSQCQPSPLSCRYQEGGKRGLPVAYMTSLETRLQDTEAALYATLCALQDQGASWRSVHVSAHPLETLKPQLSKAEKQHEWKQRPLCTSEDLAAWLAGKQQRHATVRHIQRDAAPLRDPSVEERPVPETPTTFVASSFQEETHSAGAQPSSAPSDDPMERLKNCIPPKAPNVSFSAVSPTAWLNNYF